MSQQCLINSPSSPSVASCSHFASNWPISKNVYLLACFSGVLTKDLCVFAWKPLWVCDRVRTREGVSEWVSAGKRSEAHRRACVLDERPEQAARRLCCDVRKATDRSAAKPEAPQADGWGVLMEPRLAFVSCRSAWERRATWSYNAGFRGEVLETGTSRQLVYQL